MTSAHPPRTARGQGQPATHRRRPMAAWCLGAAALLAALAWPWPLWAQGAGPSARTEALRPYAVEAGPLENALNAFARQAGVLISFDPALVRGLHSPGFRGYGTVGGGLASVLGEHPLSAQSEGPAAWRIHMAPPRPRRDAPGGAGERAATETTLPTVEVRALSEQEQDLPYRSAGSRSHISRDRIELFRGTSVGDIFQGTPGVLVGENRNSGGLDINIRGMQGQGRVPVLVDGARQEATVYRGYAGVASRSYVDPDLIGGIEIEKGPTMSAQGTGAIGGLVSARTIGADDIVRPGKTFGIRLRGSAQGNNSGSPAAPGTSVGYNVHPGDYRINCRLSPASCGGIYDPASIAAPEDTLDRPSSWQPKSWAGSIALAQRLESVDLVAAYATRRQGNYYAGKHGPAPWIDYSDVSPGRFWTDVRPVMHGASRFRAGERVVNSNYESESALLKSKFYLADAQELELSWLRYRSVHGELMPSQLSGTASGVQGLDFIRQTDNSEMTARTLAARYRWNPEQRDWLDLRINLWHTRTAGVNRSYPGDGNAFAANSRDRYKRTGADAGNTMVLADGRVEVAYGLALQTEDLSYVPDHNHGFNQGRDGERRESSAFVALKYRPVQSLTLDAGIRHTRYTARDRSLVTLCESRPPAEGGTVCQRVQPGKDSNSGSAPVVSLTWEPVPGWQFYGRHAEALRMPSMFESTGGFSVSPIIGRELKPEHAINHELGINYLRDGAWMRQDKLRLKLALFQNRTRDYLTRTIANVDEVDGGWRIRNIDSAVFRGIELSGSYDMGAAFAEFAGTRYSLIETCHIGSFRRRSCTDYGIATSYINNMIPPNWHASMTLGARLMQGRMVMGVRGTFMGRRNRLPEFNDQGVNTIYARPVEWHAYRIFDLFARYRINEAFSIDFNIDNATDRYYLDALGLGAVPAPGRTVRFSLTWQL